MPAEYTCSWEIMPGGENILVKVFADGAYVRGFPFHVGILDTPEKANAMARRMAVSVRDAAGAGRDAVADVVALRAAEPSEPLSI